MTLCGYKRFGFIGGHWCNECPPSYEYAAIEKKEAQELSEINRKLREKAGKIKRVRN
jgi:hypothetical protein